MAWHGGSSSSKGPTNYESIPSEEEYAEAGYVAQSSKSAAAPSSSSRVVKVLVALGAVGVAGVALARSGYVPKDVSATWTALSTVATTASSTIETAVGAGEDGGLTAVVTNEYSNKGHVMFDYPFLKDALLFEPYRESTVTIGGATKGCVLSWSMTPVVEGTSAKELSGVDDDADGVLQVTASVPPGQYTFDVTEKCWSGGMATTKTMTQTAWVKYVRRELMSLTDADREEFLDTFRKMWDTTTTEGIEKYGAAFKSVYYFAMVHNDGGANSICDEFHAGAGFLANHIFLGIYLERAMRMINPRVSLHYMEYTRYFSSEEFLPHVADPMDGGKWTELLTDKWFGSNDPITGEILDSRWKTTVVPRVDKEFMARETIIGGATFFPDEGDNWMRKTGPHISSPYGLIRAPWNYNPSPYLTRYNNLNRLATDGVSEHVLKPYIGSNCEDMKRFINDYTVGKPMETYLESAEDIVHGYVDVRSTGKDRTLCVCVLCRVVPRSPPLPSPPTLRPSCIHFTLSPTPLPPSHSPPRSVPPGDRYIHFTFGGMGGPLAAEIDAKLRDQYGLSNTHLFYVAESAHKFVKTYLSGLDRSVIRGLQRSFSLLPVPSRHPPSPIALYLSFFCHAATWCSRSIARRCRGTTRRSTSRRRRRPGRRAARRARATTTTSPGAAAFPILCALTSRRVPM